MPVKVKIDKMSPSIIRKAHVRWNFKNTVNLGKAPVEEKRSYRVKGHRDRLPSSSSSWHRHCPSIIIYEGEASELAGEIDMFDVFLMKFQSIKNIKR